MKRKVIKQGNGTLTITLPKQWTENIGLNSGDYVNIEDKNRGLLVTKEEGEKEAQKISVDISNSSVFLDRLLVALYEKGYDEVEIYSENPKLLEKVEESLKFFTIGFEVVKQSKNSCIIKNVADVQETGFDNVLRRVFLLLKHQAEGIAEAMEKEAITSIPNLRHMEQANNRYTAFLRRILNKKGHGDAKNEKILYSLVESLETAADEHKFLCDFLLKSGKNIRKVPKDIIGLYKKSGELIDNVTKLYYKYDSGLAAVVFQERKKIINRCFQLSENSSSRDCMLIHYLLNTIQDSADISTFTISINH